MYNYTWIDQGKEGKLAFEFTNGPWANMPFQYGTIRFEEINEENDEEAIITFDFEMLSKEHEHLMVNEDFQKDVGELLQETIIEAFNRMEENGDREVSNQESGTE